ncbi:MAG TPA: FAD-dependent oxidoreductase [Acidiferrobacterales bacterium]
MSAWPAEARAPEAAIGVAAPIVIVGTGPAGIHAAQELLKRDPSCPLVLYGDEPWEPYHRVRLSALLMGEIGWQALDNRLQPAPGHRVAQRHHCAVLAIDRAARTVRDAAGRVQAYGALILAVGSRPHIPDIVGVDRPGVYTFRDLSDVQRLLARRARSRRALVLGGGLLGLEAARALRRDHTEVCLVHHAPRLMNHQLDAAAAGRLQRYVTTLGIELILRDSIKEILGEARVTGARLRGGATVACDTVLLATGIRSNTQLALNAGLSVGRGIRVDDGLRSSDPHVFAVGECAEHRGRVYGLVAPCLEQAAVAAHNALGGDARYEGSLAAAQLKVVGLPIFSFGRVGDEEPATDLRSVTHADRDGRRYRKLVLHRNRLCGAIAVGGWSDSLRIQEMILANRRLWPWQLWRFRIRGRLWSDAARSVADWPAGATVCHCAGVSRGALSRALGDGCGTLEDLSARTGAGRVCGSCRPLLNQLLGAPALVATMPGRRGLLAGALLALLLGALFLGLRPIAVADSVQRPFHPEFLWTDASWKQVSGYTLLGATLLGLGFTLRKRWPRFRWGGVNAWRVAHAGLGALTLAVLLAHTGLRLGERLNFQLMTSFLALTALGAVAGLSVALERVPTRFSRWARSAGGLAHVVLTWPLPALIGFHIVSVYYF